MRDAYRHEQRAIYHLAVSPDSKVLAVATGVPDKEHSPAAVQLWDLTGGTPLLQPLEHGAEVRSVAFSPDGTHLLTGSADRTAQLWDARTGKPDGLPLRHRHTVSVARFTPDGRTMATGSPDGTIRWWDAATGAQRIGTLPVHQAQLRDLCFSPDGQTLVMASALRNTAGILHVAQLPRSLSRPAVRGKEAFAKAAWKWGDGETWLGRYLVSYSPDAATALIGGNQHAAWLCNAANGQPLLTAAGPLRNAWHCVAVTAYSPDGRLVATSSRSEQAVGEARLWEAATGRPVGQPLPHINYISAMAFSPDAQVLATGGFDSGVQLWDTANGQPLGGSLPQGDIVLSLAFSPDGKRLAVGHSTDIGGIYGVIVWDVAQRKRAMPPLQGPSMLVQFSPDGKTLLAVGGATLQFWDAASGRPLSSLISETAEINSAAGFSADGGWLLLSTTDGTVQGCVRSPRARRPARRCDIRCAPTWRSSAPIPPTGSSWRAMPTAVPDCGTVPRKSRLVRRWCKPARSPAPPSRPMAVPS